jgi:hypothetical protein
MTRSQIRQLVEQADKARVRELLDRLQLLRSHKPLDHLPETESRLLLDLRDHEEFFRGLADAKLQS